MSSQQKASLWAHPSPRDSRMVSRRTCPSTVNKSPVPHPISLSGIPSPWPLPKGELGVQRGTSLSRVSPCGALVKDGSALTHHLREAGDQSPLASHSPRYF